VLANQNIPYVVKGGMSFFARREIKTALAYMKLLINPADSNAFKRAVTNPKRGVGDVLMGKIDNLAKKRGISVTEAACIVKPSGKQARAKLYEFEKLLDKYRAKFEAGESLGILGDELIRESGYRAQLKREADDKRDTKPGLALCEVNIDTLFGGIEQYEEEDKNPSLSNYLQQIALIQEGDNKKLKNAVNLLTMHSAKGLEWPCVFVVGCSSSTIPYPKSVEEGRENEERRLFYVALTRAKDYLRVTFHEWSPRAKSRYHDPSPYFADMVDRPEDKNAV
jgi:ATP-dependent DNA helicase Rep